MNQESRPGNGPSEPSQEKFGLVETDRLIEAVRKSTFLLEPQKESLEQLIRAIPEDLGSIPTNVMPFLIIQRAGERDTVVSQNEHLRGENAELRSENQALKQQVRDFERRSSKTKHEAQELEEVFDGSITEKRIFERILDVYEGFVEDLQSVLGDVSCKNEDFDGLELLYVVFERLLGIDIDQLSPLEQREIEWIAKDLGYDEDHGLDTSPIEQLFDDLTQKLDKAREDPLEQHWLPLPFKRPEKEDATQTPGI